MTIDALTGKISWTANTIGSYEIQIQATDNQGAYSTQAYKLDVIANPINQAPSITSTPKYLANTNSPYSYQVIATDPDAGDSLEYEIINNGGATGIAINPNTGLLTWNNPNTGTYKVVIGAVDEGGLGAAQGFTLTARANQLPVISSDNPPTKAIPNIPYIYDLKAVDPDGGILKYSLDPTSTNKGINIDDLGRLRWTPKTTDIGNNPVTITITDEAGGIITQTFAINVQPDTTAPTVKLTYAGLIPAEKGSTITFQVQATDDVKVRDLQLLVNGQPVVVDPNGIAIVTLNTVGNTEIIAKAIDLAGNIGTATTVNIPVFDPNAVANAPKVSFASDWDHLFSSYRDIKGTVTDPDFNLQSYAVDIAPIGTDNWTNIFTGNTEVGNASTDGVLGKFDPSIISDDSYRIRLTATDTTGFSSSIEDEIDVVSNGLKLGNFTLSFTDLSIPVSGIPINVTRTYDSLNANTRDDFGYGWRLEFRDTDLRTSLPKDEVYAQTGIRSQAFKEGTKVFITLPGGKRETFTFKPKQVTSIEGQNIGIFANYFFVPEFTSEKGSTNTLTVAKNYITYPNESNKLYGFQGSPYNPADPIFGNKYILTTKEGIVYEINATTGDLDTVTNPNGNKLTFTDAGITSDTGKGITFQRDAQGKIVSATDPLGTQVKYQYDAKGDLTAVTDRESNTTEFKYQQPTRNHFLTEIVDPLGRSGIKTEYNDKGQLTNLVDALGKSVVLAYDPTNSKQTVTDALGNPTTYIYDARGNVVSELDALGGIVTRTYDDENNLLSQTDQLGRTMTYTYDSFNNKLTETDALGNTTSYTYNSYGEVLTRVNPLGKVTRYEYDSRGNRLTLTNALGQALHNKV